MKPREYVSKSLVPLDQNNTEYTQSNFCFQFLYIILGKAIDGFQDLHVFLTDIQVMFASSDAVATFRTSTEGVCDPGSFRYDGRFSDDI